MYKKEFFSLIILSVILTLSASSQTQNWPNWRGPNGDGTSIETNLPVKWDSITNVVWKTEVPGKGYASPIIWENRLFTATAISATHEKVLLCYNTENGLLLWQQTVVNTPFEAKHNDNSFASGTPATDGTSVFVSFLDGENVVVASYDFSGNLLWKQSPGKFSSPHGYSCSPVLYKDMVIINGNSKGDSFAAALSKSEGKTVWKVNYENPAHSFATPLIREMDGKTQLIFLGNKQVLSYNPDNGSRYWYINGPSEDFCSTPVYNKKNDLLLISSAWPQRNLLAIKPDGKDDVTDSKIVWQSTIGAYYVPSPVCTDDYLFTTMTNGQVHCIDVAKGEVLWKENLGKQYSSAVLANGLVYMPNDQGIITVIKPGPTFEHIASNYIGEPMNASPAISKGKIYIRGYKHLFCIAKKD